LEEDDDASANAELNSFGSFMCSTVSLLTAAHMKENHKCEIAGISKHLDTQKLWPQRTFKIGVLGRLHQHKGSRLGKFDSERFLDRTAVVANC
jgi:hypothetical protein